MQLEFPLYSKTAYCTPRSPFKPVYGPQDWRRRGFERYGLFAAAIPGDRKRLQSERSNTVSRCQRKLCPKLLICIHMCLAFRVHRIHNKELVK